MGWQVDEDMEQRRAPTACTRTRWSQGRGVKTDQRIDSAGDSRATAMNTTIKRIIEKRDALRGC